MPRFERPSKKAPPSSRNWLGYQSINVSVDNDDYTLQTKVAYLFCLQCQVTGLFFR